MLDLQHVDYYEAGSQRWLLQGINLTIGQGEWVSLIGRSGAGKSTLGRICAGLLPPSSGDMRYTGAHVGWLGQNPTDFLVGATVYEDIAFGPRHRGMSENEVRTRVDEALQAVNLEEKYLSCDPLHLSGGEQQRIALAGILAMRPSLLVLDEPTSMLDGMSSQGILSTVARVVQEGSSVLYITHNPEEAAMATRIALLDAGRIIANGPPEAILTDSGLLGIAGTATPPLIAVACELKKLGFEIKPDSWTVSGVSGALQAWGQRHASHEGGGGSWVCR